CKAWAGKKTHLAAAIAKLKRFSLRKIAEVMEVARSNLMEQLKERLPHQPVFYSKAENEQILALIKEVVKNRPTYGYRRVHAIVNCLLKEKKLKVINHKRVFRLM
uniref:IS3 family transposase n=1 Tax=Candidatus Protochlamydia sp. R18 TaxID=1353977 RepID=UPI0011DD0415